MKYIKIFNKDHNQIDELDCFKGLKYGWTLNGFGKAEFSIPLEAPKCTEGNLRFFNHIEVYDGTTPIWGGFIIDRNFNDPSLRVSCYGYTGLLNNGSFFINGMSFPVGGLCAIIVSGLADKSVAQGNIPVNTMQVYLEMTTNNAYDAISNICGQTNYDFEVDLTRKFNLYQRKGAIKDKYILEYGSEASNIIGRPSLGQSALDIGNEIKASSPSFSSTVQDDTSISLFGKKRRYYEPTEGVLDQSSLDIMANTELAKIAYPTETITLQARDSALCPFDDIAVGDSVTVSLIPYWGYNQVQRILEMTHDEDTNTREIVIGQSIYRPQPPQKKMYVR